MKYYYVLLVKLADITGSTSSVLTKLFFLQLPEGKQFSTTGWIISPSSKTSREFSVGHSGPSKIWPKVIFPTTFLASHPVAPLTTDRAVHGISWRRCALCPCRARGRQWPALAPRILAQFKCRFFTSFLFPLIRTLAAFDGMKVDINEKYPERSKMIRLKDRFANRIKQEDVYSLNFESKPNKKSNNKKNNYDN